MTPPNSSQSSSDSSQDTSVQLDRFGLPIRTADNIFPPLPAGTELIPVDDPMGSTSHEEIQVALKDYLKADLTPFLNREDKSETMKIRLLHKSPPGE